MQKDEKNERLPLTVLNTVFTSKASKELKGQIEEELLEPDPEEASLIISKNKLVGG